MTPIDFLLELVKGSIVVKFDACQSNSLGVMTVFRSRAGARTPKSGRKNRPSVKIKGFREKFLTVTHIFFDFMGGYGFEFLAKTHGFRKKWTFWSKMGKNCVSQFLSYIRANNFQNIVRMNKCLS